MTTENAPHICMLAAENDTIPGGKVGGIGDVIRDLPPALARLGASVSVLTPAYGTFHQVEEARGIDAFAVSFRGRPERVELYELYADRDDGVRWFVLHHPMFAAGGPGKIYCDDPGGEPFATDASKFALFSLAGLTVIRNGLVGDVDVLHLHDWHTGFAAILRAYHPGFEAFRSMPCVFSIHNLALQGIRPQSGNASSLQSWYPGLPYDPQGIADPRWPHCVNPMAAAIRLSSDINTVSPGYAREILEPSNQERGFYGGEGLEGDLQNAADNGRLVGIVNGVDYDEEISSPRDWPDVSDSLSTQILSTIGGSQELSGVDYLAHQRALAWQARERPQHLLTSVGRLTGQKMALLLEPVLDGQAPLARILESLDGRGLFVLLGTGDAELESRCQTLAAKHESLLFVNRYSNALSRLLFQHGDLFVMPSSFEPCGISQMLAMRHGQPCLVHAVGGLRDTVQDGVDGFHFSGETFAAQARHLVKRMDEILAMREQESAQFDRIAAKAAERRFLWSDSARRYLTELYS